MALGRKAAIGLGAAFAVQGFSSGFKKSSGNFSQSFYDLTLGDPNADENITGAKFSPVSMLNPLSFVSLASKGYPLVGAATGAGAGAGVGAIAGASIGGKMMGGGLRGRLAGAGIGALAGGLLGGGAGTLSSAGQSPKVLGLGGGAIGGTGGAAVGAALGRGVKGKIAGGLIGGALGFAGGSTAALATGTRTGQRLFAAREAGLLNRKMYGMANANQYSNQMPQVDGSLTFGLYNARQGR